MVKRLDHQKLEVATRIRDVFQASYAIEAKLLEAKDFPPLKRTLNKFVECKNDFYGFMVDKTVVAVIEIMINEDAAHIQSLVVEPDFFRQGIAQKLIDFTFELFDKKTFTVETGAANHPAIALYKKNGFVEIKQWIADFEIRKVRFEKRITTTP